MTSNFCVCTNGLNTGYSKNNYYEKFQEAIELDYSGLLTHKLVLFNCESFDLTPYKRMRFRTKYNIIEVYASRQYNKFDPFIIT